MNSRGYLSISVFELLESVVTAWALTTVDSIERPRFAEESVLMRGGNISSAVTWLITCRGGKEAEGNTN